MPLPDASAAASAGRPIVTVPSAVGVTSTVYVVPLPAKSLRVALTTERSPTTSPVTDSEKVIVAVKGAGRGPVGALSVTVGRVPSYVRVSEVDAALALPAASATFPAGRPIVTAPS